MSARTVRDEAVGALAPLLPRSGGARYRVGAVPGRRPTNRPPVSVGSVRKAA